jgi:nicotinamidase/pyrazinamidase
VLNTVRDARRLGYEVFMLADAIRAVDVRAGDGQRAEAEMASLGAQFITLDGQAA